jgi:DNA-binding transcriptional LysR family regulator
MDQLRAMEIFVEVARLRSFSEAGRRLGLTRAMVSKHILQLEENCRRACCTARRAKSA